MGVRTLKCDSKVDQADWDGLAAALGGGFFHCHASVVYQARIVRAEPLFAKVFDEADRCVGIAAGTVARSRMWPFSRFCGLAALPATPVAGGDPQTEAEVLDAVERHLRRRGVYRVDVASYHSPNSDRLLPRQDYVLTGRHEYHFDLTRSLDDLFADFSRTRRKDVRKAERHGIVTRETSDPDAVDLVRRIHNVSMERRGGRLSRVDESVSAAGRELMASGRVRVVVSYLDDEPVGACLYGLFNGLAYGLEGGSTDEGNRRASAAHLFWVSMRLFKEQGVAQMSLGGAKENEESLRKFKQHFGAIETSQPAGYKAISPFGARLAGIRSRFRGKRRVAGGGLQPREGPPGDGSSEYGTDSGADSVGRRPRSG